MTATSVDTNRMQIKGANTFHMGRCRNRSRGFGRGNNCGYGKGFVN